MVGSHALARDVSKNPKLLEVVKFANPATVPRTTFAQNVSNLLSRTHTCQIVHFNDVKQKSDTRLRSAVRGQGDVAEDGRHLHQRVE